MRFDPVLPEWIPPLPPPIPDDDLCGGPGVNVAPPGNEERIGGYMFPPTDWLLWWLLCEFRPPGIDCWPRLQKMENSKLDSLPHSALHPKDLLTSRQWTHWTGFCGPASPYLLALRLSSPWASSGADQPMGCCLNCVYYCYSLGSSLTTRTSY